MPLGDPQRRTQPDLYSQLLLGALGSVGLRGQQRERFGQVRHGIGMGRAAEGIVRRVLEIPKCAASIASPLKMYGQLGRDLACPRPIALLFPDPDLQMPPSLSAR